ncbi:hypothetical protein [Paenibacillus gansuensis]|uniref:Uncharacterized protein n=1 Tax=Paenibacillus gansuensis TaxID=306542 RepID=A0ABW5PF21_9BACL
MSIEQKRCLFCEKIVYAKVTSEGFVFRDCYCTPDGSYEMSASCYEPFNTLPHSRKREMFHIVSAYIREVTDLKQAVHITVDSLEQIERSPIVPITIESKAEKLLQYLHRHAEGPNDPVIIHQLAHSYNLTYSPNMQEFVYIMEQLKTDFLLDRVGPTIKLTEKGWRTALAAALAETLKHCCIVMSSDPDLRSDWSEWILPKIEQCGYQVHVPEVKRTGDILAETVQAINHSELLIVDITGLTLEAFYAAGYAKGKDMPIIWTLHKTAEHQLPFPSEEIRPLLWETAEELGALLQLRLTQ